MRPRFSFELRSVRARPVLSVPMLLGAASAPSLGLGSRCLGREADLVKRRHQPWHGTAAIVPALQPL